MRVPISTHRYRGRTLSTNFTDKLGNLYTLRDVRQYGRREIVTDMQDLRQWHAKRHDALRFRALNQTRRSLNAGHFAKGVREIGKSEKDDRSVSRERSFERFSSATR